MSCRLSGAKGVAKGAQQPKQQQQLRRLVACKDTAALGPGGRALVQQVFTNDTDWQAAAAPPWHEEVGLSEAHADQEAAWYNGTSLVCGVRGGRGQLDGVVECVVPIKEPYPSFYQRNNPATYMHVRPLGV
jgi:hypothetical protein